jgi:hypothetical protein
MEIEHILRTLQQCSCPRELVHRICKWEIKAPNQRKIKNASESRFGDQNCQKKSRMPCVTWPTKTHMVHCFSTAVWYSRDAHYIKLLYISSPKNLI